MNNVVVLVIKKASIFAGVMTVLFVPFMFLGEVTFRIFFVKLINILILWLLVGGIVFFLLKERMPELFSLFLTEDEQEDFEISLKSSRRALPRFFEKNKGGNLDIKVGDDNESQTGHSQKKTEQELLLERRTGASLLNSAPIDKKSEAVDNMKKADSQLLAKAVSSMINKDE